MEAEQNAKSTVTGLHAFVQLACKATPLSPAQKSAVEPALSVQTMKSARTGSANGCALHPLVQPVQLALQGTTRRFALVTPHSKEMATLTALPQNVRPFTTDSTVDPCQNMCLSTEQNFKSQQNLSQIGKVVFA